MRRDTGPAKHDDALFESMDDIRAVVCLKQCVTLYRILVQGISRLCAKLLLCFEVRSIHGQIRHELTTSVMVIRWYTRTWDGGSIALNFYHSFSRYPGALDVQSK